MECIAEDNRLSYLKADEVGIQSVKTERVMIMKNLRLVFDNINGERKDITLPMEKWISDWWYECKIVPSNDTTILIAELDGKPILEEVNAVDEINAMGTTIIMATHDRDIVDRMKKRVILLDRGRLAKDIEKGSYCNERF